MIYSKIEGNGKPIIIIHGFLGMSDNWKTFGSQLAEKNYQVHLLDMRNHGRSFHSEEFSYELMAQDVVDYCQHHQLSNIVIIGHSMGGKVAMLLATQHPQLVEKLVVIDISPREYPPHHQDILNALNAVKFHENIERSEIQNTISKHIKERGVVQFLMKNVYRKTPTQLAYRFNLPVFLADDKIIGEALPLDARYDNPTLFAAGAQSKYIQTTDELLIFKHFPKAKIVSIPNAGHWVHAENPTDLMQEVLTFIQS